MDFIRLRNIYFMIFPLAFRHMLATTFDACIEARQCRTDCRHTHKGVRGVWCTFILLLGSLVASSSYVCKNALFGCLLNKIVQAQTIQSTTTTIT